MIDSLTIAHCGDVSWPSDVKAVPFTLTVCRGRVLFIEGRGVVMGDVGGVVVKAVGGVVVGDVGDVVVIPEDSMGRSAYPDAPFLYICCT